jgi:tight adherence protein B
MRTALFDSAWGPLAVGLAIGCLMFLAVLVALARPRGAWVRSRLDAYGGPTDASAATGGDAGVDGPAWRPQVEKIHGLAGRLLHKTNYGLRLERQLDRANMRVSAAAVVLWSLLLGVGLATLLSIVGRSALLAAVGCAVGLVAPSLHIKRKGARRMRAFDAQLPDVLMTISGSLKVGQSFNHSLGAIVDEGNAPASEEFARVLADARLGRPMDEALAAMADRVNSDDLRFVLMSVAIQREIGGSLADLFQTVSDAVRQRQQFRRRVKAITATGRASAYVLLALPFVTGGLIAVVSPQYLKPLFTTTVGLICVVGATVGMIVAAFVLKKIVTIKG